MNILADENVDRQIVERLRQDGHEVLSVAEMAPSTPDESVLASANANRAVLLTADKDFGELVYRQGRVHAGVILMRLAGLSQDAKAAVVSSAIHARGAEMRDAFAVVTPATIRIRRRL